MAEAQGSSEDVYSIQHDAVSSNCFEDPGAKGRRRRQKLSNKESLFCQVCGDKANGYNFGAITCESCKAFFRRNALKNKELQCNFENNCKIDPFTRKFCTSCRLKKCFDINMKKEWILDETSLKKRKKLTRKSRDSTESMVPVSGGGTAGGGSGGAMSSGLSPDEYRPTAGVSSNMDLGEHTGGGVGVASGLHRDSSSCDSSSFPSTSTGPNSAPTEISEGSSSGPQSTVPLSEEDASFMCALLEEHKKIGGRAGLTDLERKDFSKFAMGGGAAGEGPPGKPQVLNMADVFIRRIIKFVKTLPEFKALAQLDQVALLKEGMTETLVLRSAISFDPALQGFCVESKTAETKNLNINFLAQSFGDETFAEHMKFVKTFNTTARWDKPTLILAMIINLFSPDRPGLANKELVAKAEERYSHLLQAYLLSKHPGPEARAIYPKLLMKLTDVRSYGEMTARQISRVGPNDIEPLMIEMFNLKDQDSLSPGGSGMTCSGPQDGDPSGRSRPQQPANHLHQHYRSGGGFGVADSAGHSGTGLGMQHAQPLVQQQHYHHTLSQQAFPQPQQQPPHYPPMTGQLPMEDDSGRYAMGAPIKCEDLSPGKHQPQHQHHQHR